MEPNDPIYDDIYLRSAGAGDVLSSKRCGARAQYTENNIFALLLCPSIPPIHTYRKNAVYKIFSYSQGALSRLLEASALIA